MRLFNRLLGRNVDTATLAHQALAEDGVTDFSGNPIALTPPPETDTSWLPPTNAETGPIEQAVRDVLVENAAPADMAEARKQIAVLDRYKVEKHVETAAAMVTGLETELTKLNTEQELERQEFHASQATRLNRMAEIKALLNFYHKAPELMKIAKNDEYGHIGNHLFTPAPVDPDKLTEVGQKIAETQSKAPTRKPVTTRKPKEA